jgi:hypothetical protein
MGRAAFRCIQSGRASAIFRKGDADAAFYRLDGVLADFDGGHGTVFGFRSDKLLDNVDWDAVNRLKDFYLNIPPMPDLKCCGTSSARSRLSS